MAKKITTTQQSPEAPYILDKQHARRDAKQLGLNKGDLPNSIKEVISTLNQAGFEAYVVGGGVRDIILGFAPKDFDAVTNATPSQIKEIFGKRSRIIGKRFQICHVYSGRDLIEVSTFRAPPKDDSVKTEDGMLMRDNVWGDIYQDVLRRDFSINALYYQPFEGIVYDFCGGLTDIKNRTIRLLGDTQRRVEEDPVRLLRALRFKAKLGFNFDTQLEKQFNNKNWALLAQVSPHRLYDETQKLFIGGYLMALLPLLFDYKAIQHLLCDTPSLITPLVEQVSINTDKRINQGKSINPAFFYATILWDSYLALLEKTKKQMPFADAQIQSANKIMAKQQAMTAMPKFAEQFIKDIWLIQPKLAEPRKKNILKLFESPRFRAGFDFLVLREQVESKNHLLQKEFQQQITLDKDSTNGMGSWWAWFQTLTPKQQTQAIDSFDLEKIKQRFANIAHSDIISHETATPEPKKRKSKKLSQQEQLEKDQLKLLSLNHNKQINFDNQIKPTLWELDSPAPEKAMKKPYLEPIPAQRHRREPSSDISVWEQKTGIIIQPNATNISTSVENKPKRTRRAKVETSEQNPTYRKRPPKTKTDGDNS